MYIVNFNEGLYVMTGLEKGVGLGLGLEDLGHALEVGGDIVRRWPLQHRLVVLNSTSLFRHRRYNKCLPPQL